MQRFLEVYWVIYFQAYLAAVALLLWHYWGHLMGGDELVRVYLLAAIFGAAAGGSAVFTIIVEAGGYMVLLIPARIKKLKNEGREEGRVEGREEGREERDKRYAEAMERFGYMENGARVLKFTPEVQRFLAGEEVEAPAKDRLRRYARSRRRRQR